MSFPATSVNLLSKLQAPGEGPQWQVSWKRFLELYHAPLETVVRASYRQHTGGQEPSSGFVEDAIANTIADFFSKSQYRYDATKGRLRSYLRLLANARVIDLLRPKRPIDHIPLEAGPDQPAPDETEHEKNSFQHALLATLVEDLRNQIPLRQFEVFERVKLKHHTPAYVAEEFGLSRAMVDRYIHKAMIRLRQIASQPEYRAEME